MKYKEKLTPKLCFFSKLFSLPIKSKANLLSNKRKLKWISTNDGHETPPPIRIPLNGIPDTYDEVDHQFKWWYY